MLVPLLGGAYQARSPIANAQRCVNLYPEVNTKDAPFPVTHYQRPGLRPLAAPDVAARGRGIWRASNGNGYCVIGQGVYQIGPTWALAHLGDLAIPGTYPCSLTDNGTTALLVDSTPAGYTITLANGAFTRVNDGTGTFNGATRVDFMDTFILWNLPGTNQFGSTYSNGIVFDPLYVAAKTDYPDPLMSLIVNRHELVLPGQLKTEIWYDAGNANFPFAELPGAYHEHGTGAPYSVASSDISVFMLGQDLQGQGIVFRIRGYECKRISNHALEFQIRKMAATGTITDAVGYTHQQDGHVFYQLHFPTGNQTWTFDEATGEWHQETWTDANGNLNRHRGNGAAFINATNVCIDWENGTIYAMDPGCYTDTVNGAAGPISWIRGFPHQVRGTLNLGALGLDRGTEWNGNRNRYKRFVADLECGNGTLDAAGNAPQVLLRASVDRGRTFVTAQLQSAGAPGQYETQPQWLQPVGVARDVVFELEYSFAGEAALNGAFVDVEPLAS